MCAKLPFDSWRIRHDRVKMHIQSLGIESGLIVDMEPFGLFSHLIPSSAFSEFGHLFHQRERQGLVPDLLMTSPADHGPQATQLCELKLISTGVTYYQTGSGERSVETRAKQLPKLYRDKARNIEHLYCGAVEGQTGRVQQKLEQFGDLQCFVVGQFGEASLDLHSYLKKCVTAKSRKMANVLGRPPSEFKESQILQYVWYSLSVRAVHAQSPCLLSHLGHTGDKARDAAMLRDAARSCEERVRQDVRAHFESSGRGRHLKRVGHLIL